MGITVTYDDQVKEGLRGLFSNVTLFALNDKGKEYHSFIYEAVVYVESSLGIEAEHLKFQDIDTLIKDIKDVLSHKAEVKMQNLVAFSVDSLKVNFTIRTNPDNSFEFIDEMIIVELLKQVFHLSNLEFTYKAKENQYPGYYTINVYVSKSLLNNEIMNKLDNFIIESNFIHSDSWSIYDSLITVDSLINAINRAREFKYKELVIYCGNNISLLISEDIFKLDSLELRAYIEYRYFKLIKKLYRFNELEFQLFKCVVKNQNIFTINELDYIYSDKSIHTFRKDTWKFEYRIDIDAKSEEYELSEEDNYIRKESMFYKESKSYYSVVLLNSNKSYSILKSKISYEVMPSTRDSYKLN